MKPNRMSLGTLILAERSATSAATTTPQTNAPPASAAAPPGRLRVDRRFTRASHLLLQFYIYNATRKAATDAPDVELEIKILRDRKAVLSAPLHQVMVAPEVDPARLPYLAEIPLGGLAAGVYLLQVNVTDRAARKSVAREIDFTVR